MYDDGKTTHKIFWSQVRPIRKDDRLDIILLTQLLSWYKSMYLSVALAFEYILVCQYTESFVAVSDGHPIHILPSSPNSVYQLLHWSKSLSLNAKVPLYLIVGEVSVLFEQLHGTYTLRCCWLIIQKLSHTFNLLANLQLQLTLSV